MIEDNGHAHGRVAATSLDLRIRSSRAARARGATDRERLFAAGYGASYSNATRQCRRRGLRGLDRASPQVVARTVTAATDGGSC